VAQKDPVFLTKEEILGFHREQIDRFGGSPGLRDEGLLESALMAPQQVYQYDEIADIFDLAVRYLGALTQNHPFLDGNKRSALQAALAFLKINGLTLEISPICLPPLVEGLIVGSMNEATVADHFFLASCDLSKLLKEDRPPRAPDSFRRAQTEAERHAIVVDAVTADIRMKLINLCSDLMIRPERFTEVINSIEGEAFRKVDESWRRQFGMT
jgi:death-on-curing protein